MESLMAGLDRAQGCFMGAFVGDAAGGTLEFLGRRPSPDEVERALEMNGGGVFGLAPGQITDDGELAIALARALCGATGYPRERVANHYQSWLQSKPFDVGNTIGSALSFSTGIRESSADAMQQQAASMNQASLSNGALMRCASLGVWATTVATEAAVQAALMDASLTHPDPTCGWASATYVLAIRHLILNPGDHHGAFLVADEVLARTSDNGATTVHTWLAGAKQGALPRCYPQPGFVRIAFTHAFHHLLYAQSFEDGLRTILSEGGDTDTNACIVAGLLGARFGYSEIPRRMTAAVEACDVSLGRVRPRWLRTTDAFALCDSLAKGLTPPQLQVDLQELPPNPVHLGFEARFPPSSRDGLERGFEGLSQDDKWSVCFQPPMLQIWRPRTRTGIYSFAIQLGEEEDGAMVVRDSWVSKTVTDDWGFSTATCKNIVSFVLGALSGKSEPSGP
ncbi:ADP-ribosylglycohydrolase family protein [Hydrogenophaga pseudoflava]|jgi:ADP-ribosylglycohydrolase|uniref:ADP-ribosylglycohydrolase family protein n=1 Tax=Hydrogenophaga pseudoflava TaxID=47421 RepID=UPI0009FBC4ED|nr:ADP-ribosylglycohydrolase family protein [Hydrogenophaga pseudoflava]